MTIVYYNGHYMPQHQATVPVMDRGFLYSDSIYETLPIKQGHALCFDAHINRLNRNLTLIDIQPPHTHDQWKTVCRKLINSNPLVHRSYIYIHVTRGVGLNRQLQLPQDIQPTVLAFTGVVSAEQQANFQSGYRVITTEDTRRTDRHIKATGLLPNIMAFNQAQQAGVDDVILQRDQRVLESSSSNVFLIKNQTLITARANHEIINGITRQTLLKLAKDNQIAHEERDIHIDELFEADEIWLTASNKDIVPVSHVDNQPIHSRAPQLHGLFSDLLHQYHQLTQTPLIIQHHSNKNPYGDTT